MVLERFIGPRLQHGDPKVRTAALAKLSADDPVLLDTAVADSDAAVRRAALERVVDLATLDRAARDETDSANRSLAAERLLRVLAAPDGEELAIDARVALLAARCEPGMATFLLEHAAESRVRAAALAHVVDEAVLCRVAIHDGAAELRHAALARVHGADRLEEIEHATRAHDRGVSRAARLRAQALRSAQSQHADAEALCARMEALAAGQASGLDEAAFYHLEQEWSASESGADPDLAARYANSRERFRELLGLHAHVRQARAPLHAQRQAMLAELQAATEIDDALAGRSAALLASTQQAWDAIADQDAGATQRFAALSAATGEQLRRLERAGASARPVRALIADARALANSDTPLTAVRLAALEERARRMRRPEDATLAQTLDHDLGDLLERLRQKQRRESELVARNGAEIEKVVVEMEGALARGELTPALTHHDEAERRLQALDGASAAARELRQRLQRAAPRLAELRDWQRWGVEQTRTSMCVEAEALIGSAEPPEQLARRVRAYRTEWQQLDRASGTTAKSLWDRFDRACTLAYAPCAAYFTEQAQARTANLERKEALLARLEALEKDTDWGAGDLRAVERAFHGCEHEWRALGPVDRALAKALGGRHAGARARLEQRFDPRRESEIARRKSVIADLTALAQSDRLDHAAARVKEAQAQWAPAISARRGVEQALWNDFRAACDAVFERLRAARSASTQAQQAAVQATVGVCERAEALAQRWCGPVEDDPASVTAAMEEARGQLASVRREYSEVPQASPADTRQFGARFKDACTKVERAVAARREALGRMEQELSAARARLCRELEQRVLTDDDAAALARSLEAARAAWSALPALRGGAGEAMEGRFASACAAAQSAEERAQLVHSLAAQTEEKRRLCLRVEIVAGVPSPAPHDGARLSYRAQWMQESMRGTSHWPSTDREKLEEARRIEARWHGLGAMPQSEDEQLEARYRRALSALRGEGTGATS